MKHCGGEPLQCLQPFKEPNKEAGTNDLTKGRVIKEEAIISGVVGGDIVDLLKTLPQYLLKILLQYLLKMHQYRHCS